MIAIKKRASAVVWRTWIIAWAVACSAIWGAPAALAAYPERPVTLIVPWAAGGGTDATGRIIATLLEEKIGQPINVVNRTGGGGIVGHQVIKNAKPDGYTIGILTSELSTYRPLGTAPLGYDDYSLIALYNTDVSTVFVRTDSPYKTMRDVVAVLKTDPSKVKVGVSNVGGIHHLSWVNLVQELGAPADKIFYVPTDGSAVSLPLLVSGAVDVTIAQYPEARALVEAGEIRPLAHFGDAVDPKYPQVPPMPEAAGVTTRIMGWRGLGGPKGLPDEVMQTLSKAMAEIFVSEQFVALMDARNYNRQWAESRDFAAYLQQLDVSSNAVIKAMSANKK